MTTSRLSSSTWLGIALIVLGLLFLFQQFGWFNVGRALSLLWPLLLIYLGWTLYRQGQEDRVDESGDVIRRSAVLGDIAVSSSASGLRAIRVWTLFGDANIDLRGATFTPDAVLDAVLVFGDLKVQVPTGTRIETSRPVLIGDVELPAADSSASQVLRLTGFTLLGDVKVTLDSQRSAASATAH